MNKKRKTVSMPTEKAGRISAQAVQHREGLRADLTEFYSVINDGIRCGW